MHALLMMNRCKIPAFTIYLLLLISGPLCAQSILKMPFIKEKHALDKGYEIRLGANIGYFITGEAGIAKSAWIDEFRQFGGMDVSNTYRVSYSASCEYNFRPGKAVISPKLSFTYGGRRWLHYGINVLYGTDFSKGTLYIRPQLGYSLLQYVEFSYGYNIPVSVNHMKGQMSTHVLAITGYIPVFRKEYDYFKEKDYRLK